MDGIRGSSRKGIRSLDRMAVVWRALDGEREGITQIIREPEQGEPVPETRPADWKGSDGGYEGLGRDLGLREQSPSSAAASKAGSIKSARSERTATNEDDDPVAGVKAHGPHGEDHIPDRGGSLAISLEPHVKTVTGANHISTSELPGGRPEEEMEDSKDHLLGKLKRSQDLGPSS